MFGLAILDRTLGVMNAPFALIAVEVTGADGYVLTALVAGARMLIAHWMPRAGSDGPTGLVAPGTLSQASQ